MTNEFIRFHYDRFLRIQGFATKHGGAFAAGSRAANLFAANAAVVAQMEEDGVEKLSGTAAYQGGTSMKDLAAELVRADMKAMRETAVSIAVAEGTPDFDDEFRLPRSASHAVLLTRAKSFHKDATPHEALFIEFEMPEDFLEDLAADIALLEKAELDQNDGMLDQVGGTADLAAQTAAGLKIRKQLGAIVKNKFRGSPGIRAEWESAKHIVRPAKAAKVPKTPAAA